MIKDDSIEFYAALMKFYRHEYPEINLNNTCSITPQFIDYQTSMVAEYNMWYVYDFDADTNDNNGFYFATEDDQLFFLLKWGNGANTFEDI
jgi:hypothetical protein